MIVIYCVIVNLVHAQLISMQIVQWWNLCDLKGTIPFHYMNICMAQIVKIVITDMIKLCVLILYNAYHYTVCTRVVCVRCPPPPPPVISTSLHAVASSAQCLSPSPQHCRQGAQHSTHALDDCTAREKSGHSRPLKQHWSSGLRRASEQMWATPQVSLRATWYRQ